MKFYGKKRHFSLVTSTLELFANSTRKRQRYPKSASKESITFNLNRLYYNFSSKILLRTTTNDSLNLIATDNSKKVMFLLLHLNF